MRNGTRAEGSRAHALRKTRLFLVEIDRDQLELDGGLFLQTHQHVQQAIAVLAAGQADHDAIALLDHAEIADRLAHLAPDALGKLVGFEFLLSWIFLH